MKRHTMIDASTQAASNDSTPTPLSRDTSRHNPLISVIVPTYNTERYLDQALTSIETQSYRELEIICINDGSTDGSLACMERHAERDPRIRVINKQNAGYGAGCNRGIDEAHGEWIAIVEPDDWIEQNMYADMIAYAHSFATPIDIIKTAYWRIWMPDTPQQRKMNCSYKRRIHPPRQPFSIGDAAHLLCHHPSIWSALYRRAFLQERGIRFREIPGAGWADNPFLIETLCQTNNIVYLDRAYYCYREETPEKSKAFAKRSTLLPLERWNDMADILERLHVHDPRILRAHNSRGFTYLSGIIEVVDFERDDVRIAAEHMFARMDANLVFSDPEISPGCKRLFAELRGIPCPPINHVAYVRGLIGQGIYNLTNTGIRNTLFATTSYFTKRKARTAHR